MKKKLKEDAMLFVSLLKWFILATTVGVIVGESTAFLLLLLKGSSDYITKHKYYFLCCL